MKKYVNRYGNKYWFEEREKDVFEIMGDLDYWRFGGKQGQDRIDMEDLGMCDPSGGPYITVGSVINGREVLKISSRDEGVFLTFEPSKTWLSSGANLL